MSKLSDSPVQAAIACHVCGRVHADVQLQPGEAAYCVRCGSAIEPHTRASLQTTAALALAATLLYIPANLFPILYLDLYGLRTSNTVWDGVVTFYHDRDYTMAAIVLLASIVIPLMKLLGLLILVTTAASGSRRGLRARTRLYQFIDRIGRWAMLDVFVLSVWVALVKLRTLGDVHPGEGLWPFGAVVILTLFASASFDSKLIWAPERNTA